MKKVTLGKGKASIEVSEIGYGAMGLTTFYGERTAEAEAMEVLRAAFDLGVRHFDTAQMYTATDPDGTVHYNETIIGQFLTTLSEDERKDVTVATKYNPTFPVVLDKFDEEEFRKGVEASRKRLNVECIDLFYFHRIFRQEISPIEEWMGAGKRLIEDGIVQRLALSEASSSVIRACHAIHPITCVQQEWSLFARDLEEDIVPACKELGIGIVSYSPIGRGILAGTFSAEKKPSGFRAHYIPYMNAENVDKNLQLIDELKNLAEKKGCTLGQLCLAWVMAQGAVPIPGTTNIHHLEENIAAANLTLSQEEVNQLGVIGNKVTGKRGNEAYLEHCFEATKI